VRNYKKQRTQARSVTGIAATLSVAQEQYLVMGTCAALHAHNDLILVDIHVEVRVLVRLLHSWRDGDVVSGPVWQTVLNERKHLDHAQVSVASVHTSDSVCTRVRPSKKIDVHTVLHNGQSLLI
jgi:hypothetical protein